jgi:DNA-binding winged helix-turn-helix (wHTH) protein/tetratricopeptide (TPR) repeat protein
MSLEAKSFTRFEGYVIDRPGWSLRWEDEPIVLNRKSFDVLLYLVDHRDRVVSKNELLETLWAGQFVEESNLTQQIFLLRKALSRHDSGRKIIETVPGRGYRFTAPMEAEQRPAQQEQIQQQIVLNTSESITRITVEEDTEDGESGVLPVPFIVPITVERDETVVPISAVPGDSREQTSSIDFQRDSGNLQPQKRWMPIAISACIFMIGIAVFSIYYRSVQHTRVLASAPPAELTVRVRPSLAVLSLQNTSGLSKDAWLSTAIAEMLTNELNSDDRLRIVPRTAVAEATHDLGFAPAAYSSSTLAALHGALGSALIVQGSYSLDSASPDVTVHLTLHVQDASTGKARTEISETGRLNDLFALVHQSSFALRNALFAGKQQPADDPESLDGLSSNTEAMRLYTEGLAQLHDFDMQSARSFFERAIEADAGFALAHVALSATWSELGYVERAKQEAAEAFRLSGNLPRSQKLSIEALYRDSSDDVPRAIAIYKALATFYPDEAEWSLKLAATQNEAGQYKDAINTFDALRRIPLTPSEEVQLDRDESWSYVLLGQPHWAENLEKARDIVVAGLGIARKQGGTLILARALRSECSVLLYIKPQDAAVEACNQARKIFETVGNLDAVAAVTNNLAVIQQSQGELAEALTGIQQAEHLYHEIGNLHDEMAMLENEALLNLTVGNLPVALQQAKVVAHAKNTGSDKDYAYQGDQYMTMAYTAQGRLKEARFTGMAGLDLATSSPEDASQKFTRATFLELLGTIDSEAGDFDQARKRWNDALVLQKGIGGSLPVAELDVDLIDLDLQQGHPREDMLKSLHDDSAAFATDTQTADYQFRTRLITAQAQLALGHISDAAATLAALNALDGKGNWENSHLRRLLMQASVQQAQHRNAEAVATLQQEIQQASDRGFLYRQMEGEIALARLQHQIGSSLQDLARLKSLVQEANQYGYKGLASAPGESRL